MSIAPDFKIGIRLALRARFVPIAVSLIVVLALTALLAGQFSGRQPATVTLDVGLSVIRLGTPLVAVFLLQELVLKEFDRRYFLNTLTYPRSRWRFFAGRLASVGALTFALLVALGVALAAATAAAGRGYAAATPPSLGWPYVITTALIALDLLVVVAMGGFLSVVARTPSFAVIGTLGLILVARSYSVVVALLEKDPTLVLSAPTYQSSVSVLGYLLPDLAALDVRMIALYGRMDFLPPNIEIRALSVFAYAVAFFGLAVAVFNRRRLE
ncbi:hypothetical protein [Azoarcus olearius]|uniref:Conserved hypothetical membrane protein n=1 Tax=Azoarcus sp. (strain BH72) TaxID=418699 RepID=A1KAW3_AZOSB|nr:hypothetical protein [Azoarcus olearius]CAL95969.1 conserved hypothetical membrane protein [Azoarcus olearius]